MKGLARRLTAGVNLGRVVGISVAHGFVRVEEYLTDYLLYPYLLYRGGPDLVALVRAMVGEHRPTPPIAGYWMGFAVLLALSTAINVAYLLFHDATKRDWFGFGALRGWEARLALQPIYRPLRLPARWLAFAYLSVWHSPLFATLWLRSEFRPFAMTRRDWLLFVCAILVANLGWSAVVTGAVSFVVGVVLPAWRAVLGG